MESSTKRPRGTEGIHSFVPWTEAEDDVIRRHYSMANGAMTPYQQMADELNQDFHGGKNVRKVGAVCRRDGHVNFGKPWGRKSRITAK